MRPPTAISIIETPTLNVQGLEPTNNPSLVIHPRPAARRTPHWSGHRSRCARACVATQISSGTKYRMCADVAIRDPSGRTLLARSVIPHRRAKPNCRRARTTSREARSCGPDHATRPKHVPPGSGRPVKRIPKPFASSAIAICSTASVIERPKAAGNQARGRVGREPSRPQVAQIGHRVLACCDSVVRASEFV